MKQETKRRLKSAALAVMMVVASAPFDIRVAQAADNTPVISFLNGDTTSAAHVITGKTVDIRENYSNGTYVSAGLSISKGEGVFIDKDTKNSGVSIGEPETTTAGTNVTNTYTIKFDEKFKPTATSTTDGALLKGDPKIAETAVFNIRGQYNALVPSGRAVETINGRTMEDTVTIGSSTSDGNPEPIMQYSRITIVCDQEETRSGYPHFKVLTKDNYDEFFLSTTEKKDVDPEGTFSFLKDGLVNVTDRTWNDDIKSNNVEKTLAFTISNSTRSIQFTLHPKGQNTSYITDPQNPDGPLIERVDNFIQSGTTFELIFEVPQSNAIFLTVMTPQAAIEQIEEQIDNCTGVGASQSFIRMADGEALDYIETDFSLHYISEQFGGLFKVDWQWVPTQIMGNNGAFRALTEDEKATAQALLNPPNFQTNAGNEQWQSAGLPNDETRRMVDDVKGYLIATVYYQVNGSNYQKSSNAPEKNATTETEIKALKIPTKEITIKGTGVKPTVTGVAKSTGVRNGPPKEETGLKEEIRPGTPGSSAAVDGNRKLLKMDAYQGGIPEYDQEPEGPYMYQMDLAMGEKNAASPYARVEVTGDVEAVTFEIDEGDGNGYKAVPAGTATFDITNNKYSESGPNIDQGHGGLRINAEKFPVDVQGRGSVYITITYFKKSMSGGLQANRRAIYYVRVDPKDNTPGQDNRLKTLTIQGRSETIQNGQTIQKIETIGTDYGFAFDKDTRDYSIEIPFRFNAIQLYPSLNDAKAGKNAMRVKMLDASTKTEIAIPEVIKGNIPIKDSGPEYGYRILNNNWSFLIPFYTDENNKNALGEKSMVGYPYTIVIDTPTQDPRVEYWTPPYTLTVIRMPPSDVNTLDSLGIWLEDTDPTAADNLIKNFDPKTESYEIWIPYSTKNLRVRAQKTDPASSDPEMKVVDLPDYKLEGIPASNPTKEWLTEVKQHFAKLTNPDGTMTLEFSVTSEEGLVLGSGGDRTYTVIIHREDPKDDAFMSAFEVTDADENALTYTPNFSPDAKTYTLEIPYSIKQIKLNITANDPNVSAVELWQWNTDFGRHNGEKLLELNSEDDNKRLQLGVLTKPIDVRDITDSDVVKYGGFHPFYIYISPESEKTDMTQEYLLRVRREEPSHDAELKDLTLQDQDNGAINNFSLRQYQDDEKDATKRIYHLTVPYKTTGVSFTPTANHQFATMEIAEELLAGVMSPIRREIKSGAQSKVYQLKDKPLEEKKFQIIVTAEDGRTTETYEIYISREEPSHDARLKALKTDNTENFKPLFISSKTDYTADVKEGAPGVIITPTANHPNATIRVDGAVVASGSPTDLIELLEVKQTVRIEVIAEDGVTRMVYKIEFTNQNLIEKTSNADLRRLSVNYGLMTPEFQSAVTDYEVTAKEQTWSVDIIPRVADSLATMRVLSGTRELGDYNGNYALALVDGENEVTIEVTSPDKTVKKNYDITIYRNEEEKLKNLEPLEAEDINFEQVGNPIIVKIEEYPRVGASVFNTIREEYPDRSIIFQGNDYSIRFDGKNLTRVIPQTEIYDFRMTFDSPDEEAIYDLIGERSANDDIIDDAVLCYFDYHGSLPGPATFSLSLGRRYANDTLYWHYYNKERDRIDYYGSLNSNSKGNVAVSIDHFSTYIVTPEHRIAGSEDKNGIIDELGMVSNGQDLLGSGGKLNPDTGVKEAP